MTTIAEQLNVKEFPFIINDNRGNKIYYEDSKGFWIKKEFDLQGNLIYYEDSDEYWEKNNFDSQDNRIYFENSKGFWDKCEFDSKGNMIYYEDSKGYIEDKRNIPEYSMEELIDKIGNFKLKTKTMGYYTRYQLEIVEGNDYKTDYEKEIGKAIGYINCFEDEIKWYEHEKDMRKFSKKYPKTIFALKGEGEERDDIWTEYYKNGKMQCCKTRIVVDEFNESLLE